MFGKIALVFLFFLTQCGQKPAKAPENPEQSRDSYDFDLKNSSQFALVHCFLHDDRDNFSDKTNNLKDALLPGNEVRLTSQRRYSFVTVTREKSKNGALRSYTTAAYVDLEETAVVEYLDDYFRGEARSSL